MGKQLILAVAGSGKTTKILNSISPEKRSLVITYTNENVRSLEASLVKNFGRVPDNVYLRSYFSFLYSFCFRPFFSYQLRDNAFTWRLPNKFPAKNYPGHYVTKNRYLYANRVAKYLIEQNAVKKIIARLEKYFDSVFVDEVQDFAANDFNLLLELTRANVNFEFVGDFYQHTFDTSRDGNTRANLHKKGVEPFIREFAKYGFEDDTESLKKSYRCSSSVCEFISEHIGIPIHSHRTDLTSVNFIQNDKQASEIFNNRDTVKLFYQNHDKYPCFSNNWGKSKGQNSYGDVCVVLNKGTAAKFKARELRALPNSTRNKLYVACSRAHGDLYLMDEARIAKYFQPED